jgi:putative ATPase
MAKQKQSDNGCAGPGLFEAATSGIVAASAPLAARFRPRSLEEYKGQEHLLGKGKPLRRLIESGRLTSLILWGPPGTGKTSLAQIIARHTNSYFERVNGVEAGVADLRRIFSQAQFRLSGSGERTILFVDEIHRFNKAQQDVLLPDVESGLIRLIGATTHNPSFFINGPLVSRSQVFALEPLCDDDIAELIESALQDAERGLGSLNVELDEEGKSYLVRIAEGDARRALNGLELAALTTPPNAQGKIVLTRAEVEQSIQRKVALYDHDEEQHYDTISAFIKSVRGSDPDAAVYWLAKMIEAGEDPRFIARRLVILAAEDIGLADPRGIMVAVAAQQAVEFVGMPEGRIPLSEATLYLATAPKSNRAYLAIDAALKKVRDEKTIAVPKHLRDASAQSSRAAGAGVGYMYSHDYPGGIAPQSYGIETGALYKPSSQGYEKQIAERLEYWKKLRSSGQ